jgi:mitotic-spindle organizing protein 1
MIKTDERGEENDDDDDDDVVVIVSARKGKKILDITHEMSNILDCGVDRETMAVCISLLENGADPESLAVVVKELKREAKRLRESRERATTRTAMENSRDRRRV